jgi:hypothetical protein
LKVGELAPLITPSETHQPIREEDVAGIPDAAWHIAPPEAHSSSYADH